MAISLYKVNINLCVSCFCCSFFNCQLSLSSFQFLTNLVFDFCHSFFLMLISIHQHNHDYTGAIQSEVVLLLLELVVKIQSDYPPHHHLFPLILPPATDAHTLPSCFSLSIASVLMQEQRLFRLVPWSFSFVELFLLSSVLDNILHAVLISKSGSICNLNCQRFDKTDFNRFR